MLLRPFNWISGIFIAAFLLSPIVADARQFGLKDVVPEILSFNAAVKNERPDLYRLKLRTMLADPFSFLRATAHVMYRDIEQSPELEFLSTSPQGLAGGDMHVHNFGVLYFPGKTPSYSPEDLDEARTAPLSYDLFRLCVSLAVAFEQFDQGTLKGILVSTIDGYREGLAHANAPDWPDLSFPPKLRHFLKKVAATDKTAILSKYTVAQIPNRFKKKDTFLKLSPQESDDVKSALMPFLLAKVRENHLPKDNATILDIIAREDKGLSSIGLKRYQVLIEGRAGAWEDNRIIEVKEMRPSCVKPTSLADQQKYTITALMRAHRDRDVFLGVVGIHGRPYLVRQLFSWSDRFDASEWGERDTVATMGRALGAILADFHAPSKVSTAMSGWLKDNIDATVTQSLRYALQVREDWGTAKRSLDRNAKSDVGKRHTGSSPSN